MSPPTHKIPDLACVILAGGLGRRIGGDKALVTLAGRPLIAHVRDRMAPQVAALAVNANGDAGRLAFLALPILPDTVADFPGPLAGILAAMEWAAVLGHAAVLTVPTDCPFLPADLAGRLAAAGWARPVCATFVGRRHPTVALWPTVLAPALRAALVDEGMRRLEAALDRFDGREVVFDAYGADDPFFNVNTPADLDAAHALLARA